MTGPQPHRPSPMDGESERERRLTRAARGWAGAVICGAVCWALFIALCCKAAGWLG